MKTTLRRLLQFACLSCVAVQIAAQDTLPATDPTNAVAIEIESADDAPTNEPDAREDVDETEWRHSQSPRKGPIVAIGRTAELRANESAESVVAIMGSAHSAGRVRDAVVAVLGDAIVSGEVGETVVAVMGNVQLDGEVRDAVVAVMGNVTLGSNAVVRKDVVAVGGRIQMAEGARIHGQMQELDFHIPGLPRFDALSEWIRECVLKLRPLAPQVRWIWGVAGVYFLIYLLVAVAFPRPVTVCVNELTKRPATTFFVGLLTKILVPVLTLVLILTGVGIIVVPFVFAAALFAGIIGKVALLEYLGGSIVRAFGVDSARQRLIAFLIGTAIMVVLYIIPIVGFLAYTIFGMWSMGAAVTAAFSGMSRERPRTPSSPTGTPGAAPVNQPPVQFPQPYPTGAISPEPWAPAPGQPPANPMASVRFELPKAGFWERMGAAFLDVALLTVAFALTGPFVLIIGLAYFAGMWAWKGTTLGGLVLKHQVVRQDGSPLTFLVALVRGLAAFFSALVFFLGFIWIGWDREKQGWHDMIAGTYVVRLPHAVPLVCL